MNQNRRDFLHRVLVAASIYGTQNPSFAAIPQKEERQRFLSLLLGELRVGTPFYDDWIIEKAFPPRAGAVIIHLRAPNQELFRIDVCQRGSEPLAPIFTEHLEFFVMDGGEGKAFYSPAMKQAIHTLAQLFEKQARVHLSYTQLFTHKERLKLFPDSMSKAARELVPTIIDENWNV